MPAWDRYSNGWDGEHLVNICSIISDMVTEKTHRGRVRRYSRLVSENTERI